MERSEQEDMSAYKARVISTHIRNCLSSHAKRLPMIVGMQGPQGSGKSTITEVLRSTLQESGCRVAVLGLDGEWVIAEVDYTSRSTHID
jgi:D-glycerate 3-kinase